MAKPNKIIAILDPGFSGCKIVINGQTYNIPFAFQDITDKEDGFKHSESSSLFVRSLIGDRTYLFGDLALAYMRNPKNMKNKNAETEAFYSMDRFGTDIFNSAAITMMAYALLLYTEDEKNGVTLEDLKTIPVIMGATLPQQNYEEYLPTVSEKFKKTHDINILRGSSTENVTFTVKRFYGNGQALSALNKELANDDGSENVNSPYYSKVPLLIIDAGYKTVGIVEMDESYQVTYSESNTSMAMKNINDAVADQLRAFDPDINGYEIDALYEKKKSVRYYDEQDHVTKEISVVEPRDKELANMANKLMTYLEDKFARFRRIEGILVAGGTGKEFHPHIKEYISTRYAHLAETTLLADSPFQGEECDPVFAVAVGMYKYVVFCELSRDEDEE